MTSDTQKWIYWLDEVNKEHADLVGRKCANLGEMTRAGFRVPKGFALSVDAYRLFLEKTDALDEMRGHLASFHADPNATSELPKWAEASDALRAIVESRSMPADMAETIRTYYKEVCRRTGMPDCAVATRSAGPLSHPGQYETFLHVRGESEVLRNIIRVWGSTFNQRSLVARARAGLPLEFDPIGVAVLQMVNARVAGVMFTLNPGNGDPSKVSIGGSWGLGESVVSGSVTPDEWMVDKVVMEVCRRAIAPKCMMYMVDSSSGREEVVAADVPWDQQNIPCLSDEEILELARIGKTIEQHYGTPQDIEWVIDKGLPFPENIFIVQTRAETAWRDKNKQSVLGQSSTLAGQVSSYFVNIKG